MVAKCDCGQVPAGLFGRRDFIRIGSLGMFGLGLRDFFAMQALANETPAHSALKAGAPDRSVILVWLSGGPPADGYVRHEAGRTQRNAGDI